jgi:hypothetical protein
MVRPIVTKDDHRAALDRIAARLGGADFDVVAIAVDRQGDAVVRPFLEKLRLSRLALYLDSSNAVVRVLGAPGLPVSVVLGILLLIHVPVALWYW